MIVGLSGYARAGKNEAARGLEPVFRTVAFADKLRDFLFMLNPVVDITPDSNEFNGIRFLRVQDVVESYGWDGYKESPYGNEMRALMQRLGTDCGRNLISDSIWVDATLDHVGNKNVVVADCRFPNEARAIKKRGGIVIRIEKPGVGPVNAHQSETALDNWDFDYTINNTGSISDLHFAIQQVVKQHSV